LSKRGFLGTAAPLYADLALLFELAMGVALLMGWFLARTGRYRSHALCQSSVVLLNFAAVALVMTPSFRVAVTPAIPDNFGNAYYWIATAHAAVGTLAEIGGLYVLVAAGTKLLPRRLRLTRYKLWMRITLAIWWLVLLLGIATYVQWYMP
jgi:uncharacterized membrane protein YozB (DUF420 family)